jgi:hypothetical protein
MKKVILFACIAMITCSSFANATANAPKISEKVLKAFNATFKNVQDVVWTDTDNKNSDVNIYSVKFSQDGINTFVKYDEEGNFLSSRRYYHAEQLPVDIQCMLKKKYSDKTIFGVTEFTVGDNVNYYVKLEGAKTWTTLKIDNARNIEVTEKYQKI